MRRNGLCRGEWYAALWALSFTLLACGGGGGGGGPAPGGGTPTVIAPSNLSYGSGQTYIKDVAINALNPTVTGSATSYTVAPALPEGLVLNAATGQISGTPTQAKELTTYTFTAANAAGSTHFDMPITVIAVEIVSGKISRSVVNGTSIDVAVVLRAVNFTFSDPLYSAVQDNSGVFDSQAAVIANGNGTYTFTLTTSNTIATKLYNENLTLALCSTLTCDVRQTVPAVNVAFDVNVMSVDSEWPGDNLTALEAWSDAPEWSMFQGNAAHTGYVPVQLDPNAFSTRWELASNTVSTPFSGRNLANLTIEDGRFFVAADDRIYARNEHDASEVWNYDFSYLEYPSSNPAAVKDGVVYVAAGQQHATTYFFAFEADDGSPVFTAPMSSQWERYLAPAIGEHGVYTNAGSYGGMYAFNFRGEELFPMSFLAQTSAWSPAVDASGVYVYTGGLLQVFDPLTGVETAQVADPNFRNYIYEIGGSPVLGGGGSVFVANYGNSDLGGTWSENTLIRFDVRTESIAWDEPGIYPTTPAYDDGVVYAANENPLQLEARAESNGELLWSWTPPLVAGFEGAVLLTRNLVFISMETGTFAIDRATHRTVWSYPLAGHLALSRSGILYIQGATKIVAINVR